MWKLLKTHSYYYIVLLTLIFPAASGVLVDTAQGRLRGLATDTHTSFIGVPYATIDSPKNNFRRASAAPSWAGTRDARTENTPCPGNGSRDTCLRLHVHVPRTAPGRPRPVLVWVAAGVGTYHPANLVQRGIILVKIDYRTGPYGFLCSDEEAAPGNAGAKDVVLGLRWVRDNVAAFGGDPSRVTLAGQGFGAALVDALTLSPMARGLFHGAIAQSGSSLCPWAFNYDAKERARNFIDQITPVSATKNNYNISKLIQMDRHKLTQIAGSLNFSYFSFGMCVEKAFKKEERLLREPPIITLKGRRTTNIPLLIGYNRDEAHVFLDILERFKVSSRIQNDMIFLLPEELVFYSRKELKEVVNKIKDEYFKDRTGTKELINYYRDAYFQSHIVRGARLHAQDGAPVYLYEFEHRGAGGAAAHSDELHYLFPESDRVFNDEDLFVQKKLTTLWTDFVHHFNPTPAPNEGNPWEVFNVHNPRVYALGAESRMQDLPRGHALRLWDDIYEKHLYLQHERDYTNIGDN